MGVIFRENFLSPITPNAKLGFGWHNVQTNAGGLLVSNAYQRNAAEPTLQITVNPGDAIPAGSSGERAQLTNMMNPVPVNLDVDSSHEGKTEFIAFSILLPQGFQCPNGWGIPLQLHPPADAPSNSLSPSIDLSCAYSPGQWLLETRGGDTSNVQRAVNTIGPCAFGVWTDFILAITYGIDNNASITVYRRDNMEGAPVPVGIFPGANLYSKAGLATKHYYATGFYRNNSLFTNTLYRSKLVRATTFSEAVNAAFNS